MPENKYKTPNGQVVAESQLRAKYGDRFDSLLSNGTFQVVNDTPPADNNMNFYQTPNGSLVTESTLRKKYGSQFDSLVANNTLSPVKKKEDSIGGTTPLVNSNTPTPQSQSDGYNGLGDILDPAKQFTVQKVTTTTGNVIPIDENKIPITLRTPNFISDIQNRINNGTSLPQDQQIISFGSGYFLYCELFSGI